MESNNDNVKRGVWTPWAQVLCYECHGNENLPDPKTDAEWARMIEPVPLMEDKAVTFCDSCHTDIQVYDSVAYEHNLVKALKDRGFDAVMAQTGGMMSGCSITPSEDLQKNGEPNGISEILITYNDSGDNLYWMGVYDNDVSPADVEWGNISFRTEDEVINWAYSNQEKIAKFDAPGQDTQNKTPIGQANPNLEDCSFEYRNNVAWNISYAGDGNVPQPAAGWVIDMDGNKRITISSDDELDGFNLVIDGDDHGFYELFDEALDVANRYVHELPPWDQEGYIIRDPCGNEGIYHLGAKDGVVYMANAFWSDEPGYVNFGLFAIEKERMTIIDSGLYNGYRTIENCVRDLASDRTPMEYPDIWFVADCSHKIGTVEEYREALGNGMLDEAVSVMSWEQIADSNKTARSTPEHEKLLKSIMEKGNAIQFCQKGIEIQNLSTPEEAFDNLLKEARGKAAEKNAERTNLSKDLKPPEMGL